MCRVMCRCVAVTLGLLLLFSCTTRKQLTAALHEEVRRAVETHLADTVWKHSVEPGSGNRPAGVSMWSESGWRRPTLLRARGRHASCRRALDDTGSLDPRTATGRLALRRAASHNTDGRQQPVLGTGGSRRATTDRWRGIVDTLCDSGRAEHCLGGTGF